MASKGTLPETVSCLAEVPKHKAVAVGQKTMALSPVWMSGHCVVLHAEENLASKHYRMECQLSGAAYAAAGEVISVRDIPQLTTSPSLKQLIISAERNVAEAGVQSGHGVGTAVGTLVVSPAVPEENMAMSDQGGAMARLRQAGLI